MDDFYIVLPSNACPDIHPQNSASKYIVSWQNPIELDHKWKVALTELNFNYTLTTVNRDYGLKIFKTHDDGAIGDCELKLTKHKVTINKWRSLEFINCSQYCKFVGKNDLNTFLVRKFLYFTSKYKFYIRFGDLQAAKTCGFPTHKGRNDGIFNKISKRYEVVSPKKTLPFPKGVSVHLANFYVNFTSTRKIEDEFLFRRELTWDTSEAMVSDVSKELKNMVKKITYDSAERIRLDFDENVYAMEFLNGFNLVMGYEKRYYEISSPTTLTAEHAPQLRRGINNMYIYASVCAPIQVGDVLVPLLKSIWLNVNKNYQYNEIRSIDIKNPMYVPVALSSINTIEINIRSDSGYYIPFSENAVTVLTLHFKYD